MQGTQRMSRMTRYCATAGWIRFAAIVAAASLLSGQLSLADLPSYDRVRVLAAPIDLEDAELTDQDGQAFSLSALRGRVALIFFGFTNCPDVCPVAMEKFRQFRRSEVVDAGRTAFVMISVDGDRDTPAVMKAYLAQFSSDFIGLTAPPAEVKPLAAQFSAAFFKRATGAGHGDYTMAHSPQVFVVDPRGRLRAEMYSASLEAMGGITAALLAE